MALGIFQMSGFLGIDDWKWLFLLEGIPAIFVAWAIMVCTRHAVNNTVYFISQQITVLARICFTIVYSPQITSALSSD